MNKIRELVAATREAAKVAQEADDIATVKDGVRAILNSFEQMLGVAVQEQLQIQKLEKLATKSRRINARLAQALAAIYDRDKVAEMLSEAPDKD